MLSGWREADIALQMVRPAQSSLVARKLGGIAIGAAEHSSCLARAGTSRRPQALLQIPPLPCWLAVHREIRGSKVVRRVYDFLAEAIPRELACAQ